MVRLGIIFSTRLVYSSWMQGQTCTLSYPWSSKSGFPWFYIRKVRFSFSSNYSLEEWLPFHQYSQLMVRLGVIFSRLVYSSWMQAQTCTLSYPWSPNSRFPWIYIRKIRFSFSHETSLEEWSSFHQYSQLMVRLSIIFSRLVYSSWMQAQTCTLSYPWSSNLR